MTALIRNFCIENNYFTLGTNEQYQKLFDAAESGKDAHALTWIIWTYSDNHDDFSTIEHKVTKLLEGVQI